jgi:hypothetical protein
MILRPANSWSPCADLFLVAAIVTLRIGMREARCRVKRLVHVPDRVQQPDHIECLQLVRRGRRQGSPEQADAFLGVDGRRLHQGRAVGENGTSM